MNIKNGLNDCKKYNLPLKIKNYKIEKELFTISNSHIFLGTNLNIKEKVLIKIYIKDIFQHNPEEISLINNEIYIMRVINHKHCLKLYEIIESTSFIFLIMEYASGVKLIDRINRSKKLTEEESLHIYKQIISILLYFHDMNIGHLNINPEHFLIDNHNNIKLCDFKYSLFYSKKEKVKLEDFGDLNYLCPEMWSEKSCYPEYADIWASGVLLYFLIVGDLPFKGINNFDLQKKIMAAEFPLPLNISKNMQDLFKNIFEAKIEKRYNLDKILNSPLFKEKKITKNLLPKGFNIFTTKYPIDEIIIEILKNNFDITPSTIKQKLYNNIFDPMTSLYKQILSSFIRKKISSEIDLTSKKFYSYISNDNNFFDENTKKNNVEENLKKFEEIKKSCQEQKIKILDNQNILLNKLNEIINKYIIKEYNSKDKIESEIIIEKEKIGINKENINKNNSDINNSIDIFKKKNKNVYENRKRGSQYLLSFSSRLKKDNLFDNKNNLNINTKSQRRITAAFNDSSAFNHILEKTSSRNEIENTSNKAKKYTSKMNHIIKESNEEEKINDNSYKSTTISSLSKKTLNKKENKKEHKNDINSQKNNDKKEVEVNTTSNKNDNMKKENKKTPVAKTPQISKQDFFNQIKGVKLKKYNPNINVNPDENIKKAKEDNKNAASNESNNKVSVKGVKQIIEENLKNSKKNKNNLNSQQKNPKNISIEQKTLNIKENKVPSKKMKLLQENEDQKPTTEKIGKFFKQRKSIDYSEQFLFKTKAIIISEEEINKKTNNDNSKRLSLNSHKNFNNSKELLEIKLPKKQESYQKKKEGEKKNKKNEEKIKKEREDKERKSKEEIDKKRKEEERIRIEQEVIKLKQEEEERIMKELEEEERLKKEKEEEEEKKKKHREEIERKRKEQEQEEKKKEEEERIKKEREKEKLRLEEEEKIKKWKEEKRLQKEKEEKLQKEAEEKLRIEEEERIKKRKEENEKKKREIQEENKRLLEEYERKRREEEKKIIEREKMKKKKEEEIRRKREMEFKAIRDKKIIKSDTESETISEEVKPNKKKKSLKNNNNLSFQSNPFYLHKKENSDEKITPKIHQKKKQSSMETLTIPAINRSSGPKFYEFNNFRKQEEAQVSENEPYEEKENTIKKENKNNPQNETKDSNKNSYDKFTDFFFSDNKINNKKKKEDDKIKVNENKENKENKENQENKTIFYRYQLNQEKDKKNFHNRSYQHLNNNLNDKNIYNPIQSSHNITINQDYFKQNKYTLKRYKKLKVNTNKENQRNTYSIKMQRKNISKNKNNTYENSYLTEISSSDIIKSNNTFKKNDKEKILTNKKRINKAKLLPNYSEDYEQKNFHSLATSYNNKNNTYQNGNLKSKKYISNINAELDIISSSNSSNYSIYEKKYYNRDNNRKYPAKSKISNKIKNINNKKRKIIITSNTSSQTLIKIKKNSLKKRKNLNEDELPLYKGEIDYNQVSLKSMEETINNLIKQYEEKGFSCIKVGKAIFKFFKGLDIYIVEIMNLGNGLLYYNIIKS